MREILDTPYLRSGLIRFLISAPWVPFFYILSSTVDKSEVSRTLLTRMDFALKYHFLSTILTLATTGVKYHSQLYKIDTSKKTSITGGAKALGVLESVCAWIALAGIVLAINEKAPAYLHSILIFYICVQIIIIVTPFVRLLLSLRRIRKNKGPQEGSEVTPKATPIAQTNSDKPRGKMQKRA